MQDALNQEHARQINEAKHQLQMQREQLKLEERRAVSEMIKARWNMVIKWVGWSIAVGGALAVIGLGAGCA